jgi:hypothetical protein
MPVANLDRLGLSAGDAGRLSTWMPEIAAALRPGVPVTAIGDEIRIGRKGSLVLHADGGWHDHEAAVGGFGGSTLIVHLRDCTPVEARQFAQGWLRDHPGTGRFVLNHISEAAAQERAQRHAAWAKRITETALPLSGTPSETYLAQRGLTGPHPVGLLAHMPNARLGESALVARLTLADGTVIGVQLGYLAPQGHKSTLLPQRRQFWIEIDQEKRAAGLFRIPPTSPSREEPGEDGAERAPPMLIVEGVENALSLHMAMPQATVLGLPGIARLQRIPPIKGHVVVVRDGDPPDAPASAALIRGLDHLLLTGAKVRVTATPPGADANSLLQSGGIEALRALVLAAEPAQLSRDGEVLRLAALNNVLDYDVERVAVAKRLGVRRSQLDKEVAARRKQLAEAEDAGEAQTLGPEPWPEPVTDIAAVLSEASDELAKYVVASQGLRDASALWALHTHFVHHDLIYLAISPRLAIQAVAPMCGKSTLLELCDHLVCRPLLAASLTPAVVYRAIDKLKPTLLIDEADKFMRSNRNPELVGILNASHHRRTAVVPRNVPLPDGSWEIKLFSAWCTYAFTGVGRLEDQLQSRSISIFLKRALPAELAALSTVEDGVSQILLDCGRKFARWAQDQHVLPAARIPDAVLYRDRDNWRPLLRIAQLAGDDWPARAAAAAVSVSGVARSIGDIVPLLADIRAAFGERERITTESLIQAMLALPEPSVDWTTAHRGRPINAYYLRSRLNGVIDAPDDERSWHEKANGSAPEHRRGYLRKHFADAFARYLSADPAAADSNTAQAEGPSPASTGHNHSEQAREASAAQEFAFSPGTPDSSGQSGQTTNKRLNTREKTPRPDDFEASGPFGQTVIHPVSRTGNANVGPDGSDAGPDAPDPSGQTIFANENNYIFVVCPDQPDESETLEQNNKCGGSGSPSQQPSVEDLPILADQSDTELWLHPDAERGRQ